MALLLTLISLGFFPATPVLAAQVTPVVYSTSTAQVIIEAYAVRYGIPSDTLVGTLRCESGFNSTVVGDGGTSWGVAQIHLPAHPNISKEQALDPIWSIDFAARMFSEGKQSMWTCYKQLYGQHRAP